MVFEIFIWCVVGGSVQGIVKLCMWLVQFGDGYQQVV